MVDCKKGLKHVNSKKRTKENIGLLPDEVGYLTNREEDKAETFTACFASVFNTHDGSRASRNPGSEDRTWGCDKLPVDFELV